MKPRESALTHEMLTEALDYDPETGVFTRKTSQSNGVKIGDVAGWDCNGHTIINLYGVRHRAHRLAWFYVHKVWPKDEIDHINRKRGDNRICNLREANRIQNMRNVAKSKRNTTGFKGVTRHKFYPDKFMAQISATTELKRRKTKYLGIFDTAEEAHAAYVAASRELHGEFGRED